LPHSHSTGVLVPEGMLGAGFDPGTVTRGIALGADVIAVDGGSTDSGPHYLGTGQAKTAAGAVRRDLRILLRAAHEARIPLVIGSCGTAGTDSGVRWVAGLAGEICAQDGLRPRVARIYSEQQVGALIPRLRDGRIHPLPPRGELAQADLERCEHIVAMMGHEPIEQALRAGADVVLAGRATDTALAAVVPLMRGLPPGPVWHAAKIAECGGQCTTDPRAGGVLARIDATGFTIEPLNPAAACTPVSVAAHMLYETANPVTMREPGGTIEVEDARYTAVDDRIVRVEGSRFEPAAQYTVKLEGAAVTGYETVSFVAIRDPRVLAAIDVWGDLLVKTLTDQVRGMLGLGDGEWAADLRLYGHNGVLRDLEPAAGPPREVGVMLLVSARDQATAEEISKVANPLLLHLPLPGMAYLPSFAFATSPPHLNRGAAHEFVLNHVVDVGTAGELFRTEFEEPAGA
jgi:Acyclic terpene utilisation family protein AtuA